MSVHGRMPAMMTCCALLISLLAAPHAAPSSAFDDLLSDLVGKIAAAVAPADRVHLVLTGDQTSEPSPHHLETDIARRLDARGIRVADSAAGIPVVRVSCSKNLRARVCAADIRKTGASVMVMATGETGRDTASAAASPLMLEMRHLFSQAAPILDVALVGDRLIVLDAAAMTLYQRAGAVWQKRRSQPTVSSRVWPRDIRGRLHVSGASVEAFLPGAVCRATTDSFTVSCADERQPWPLAIDNTGIAGGRNYFTTPEGLLFYGSALLESDAGGRWLLVAERSRLLLLDESRRALEPALGSGDDIAGVTTCVPGAFVLVSSPASGGEGRDLLRLFRVLERRLVPAASSLLLPGNIAALWAEPGSNTATAVVHDSASDRYDALQIGVACGR